MVSDAQMRQLETELRHLRNDLLYRRLRERDIQRAQRHASRLMEESADRAEKPALRAILDLLETVHRTRQACEQVNALHEKLGTS